MRTRALAAVVVVTWAKTSVAAPGAIAASTTDPPGTVQIPEHWRRPPVVSPPPSPAPDCTPGELIVGPALSGSNVVALSSGPTGWKSAHCQSGTLSLGATADGQHWKALDSQRVESQTTGYGVVQHACLPGAWTYQVTFASDDRSYKSSHSSSITC